MNNKTSSRFVAYYGIVSALMFAFLLVETYGFAAFLGAFTPAILTLPLAISVSMCGGKKSCVLGGAIFGCCSFFLAVFIANPVFINPLVSILPRLFIGVVAYFVYLLFVKITKNAKSKFVSETLPISIGASLGILTNTVCTIFMMWIFNASSLATVMTVIISFNFLGEIVGAMVLCPVYVKLIKRING